MKLSEMNTKQMAAAMCRIAAPIERIGKSEAVGQAFKRIADGKGKGISVLEMTTSMIGALAPVLMDAHYEDTVEIVSALTGKTVDEINAQKGIVTLKEAKDCIDEVLLGFFKRSGSTEAGK